MLDSIIAFSVRNKLVISLLTLMLVIAGIFSLSRLPVDAVPDITNNQVQVITQSPSLSALEVEQFITAPLELGMANLPGIVEIRSISRFGLSVITLVFVEDQDVHLCRMLVSEQLKKAEKLIPENFGSPELAPISTGLGEIYQYVIKPKPGYERRYDPMELRTIQDWIIKRQLSGIPGVIDINSFGGFVRQYEVSIDVERLKSLDISIQEVFTAIEHNNQNTGGSYIEKNGMVYFIRSEGLIRDLKELEDIVILNRHGQPILIRHIANVRFGHSARYGAMTSNGKGEVVGGIVMMLKGANSNEVIKRIKERIEKVQTALPEGLAIHAFLDRSDLVNRAIKTVYSNLLEGGLIVIFVLVIFLGNFRAGLLMASVIPLSLLFAFCMMRIFGVSANLMSLGAIDFGLVVDGSVIIVEGIIHQLKKGYGNRTLSVDEMNRVVTSTSQRIRKSAAFGEIIILIVYIPILTLEGIEGRMFKPMAQTVGFAILGALILSFTYVPMMASLLLSRKISGSISLPDRIIQKLHAWYKPVLEFALWFRLQVLFAVLIVFLYSMFIFNRLGGEFIPTLEEGDFAIETRLIPGNSLSRTIDVSTEAEKILLGFPEVKEAISKIGTSEIPTDPMPMEANDLMVILRPKEEWVTVKTREALADTMKRALEILKGVNFEFQQPIQMRFNELMTGVKSDLAVKIYGENLDSLYHHGNLAAHLISGVDGVADLKVEQVSGLPQIEVKYAREKLARYGADVNSLNNVLQTAFAGNIAGLVYEGDRRFELVVRLDSVNRTDIDQIRNLPVFVGDGRKVPMKELAEIYYREVPVQISRDNAKRRIVISANVRNRDVASVVEDIQREVKERIKLPEGYYFTYGGQFENLKEAKARLLVVVPLALLFILFLLYLTFHSFAQALLIFTAIPLASIGGILALWIRGMPFSISAGVGFIALFGVAVLNGIVLMAYLNHLKEEGITDVLERIRMATAERLRPVLMTALVASLGFLPMALSNSPGAEVQKPLATVVIGGLITATALTLIVLPILYSFSAFKIQGRVLPVVPILFIAFISFPALCQQAPKHAMSAAVEMALTNNSMIYASSLEIESQKRLGKAAVSIPKTNVDFQYGQTQATNTDYTLNLVQEFSPSVYRMQAKLSKSSVKLAENHLLIRKNDLSREVKILYLKYAACMEKLRLFRSQDSLFRMSERASEIRYQTGETNQLELISARSRSGENQNRIQMLEAEALILQKEIERLVMPGEPFEIDPPIGKLVPLTNFDTILLASNPNLLPLRTSLEITRLSGKLERSRLFPDFRIGYINQSVENIRGLQAIQGGIAIPLWFTAQRAKSRSYDMLAEARETALNYEEKQLLTRAEALFRLLERYEKSLAYYETNALNQAVSLIQKSYSGFVLGELEYVEYVQNSLQAWQIREAYIDQLYNYNFTVVQLEHLAGIIN